MYLIFTTSTNNVSIATIMLLQCTPSSNHKANKYSPQNKVFVNVDRKLL